MPIARHRVGQRQQRDALVRNGVKSTFFADGVSQGTPTTSVSIPDAAAFLTLGQAENLGFFDGRLDEAQIYGCPARQNGS